MRFVGLVIFIFHGLLASGEAIPANSPRWELRGQAKVVDYDQRSCLFLRGGQAILKDFALRDGVIDVDVSTPETRGFFGIYFRITPDGNGEWVYLRPQKSGSDDAQQYTPIFRGTAVWQLYNGPGFTAAVDVPRQTWMHLRLEVAGAQAKLYVKDMSRPSLVMPDLKSGVQEGSIMLSGPAYFTNFQVSATTPVAWKRNLPPMPTGTLDQWQLSPAFPAESQNPEQLPASAEWNAMKWENVSAEAPGTVVINRYRDPPIAATVEFEHRLEPQPGAMVAYARTSITTDRDETRKLEIGYSDDVSIFLNGRILYRGRSAQHFRDPGFLGIVNAENDAIFLPLANGRNELVLAVTEVTGGWGFICRLAPSTK